MRSHRRGKKARVALQRRTSFSRTGHSNGTRTTSMLGSMRSSRDSSVPVNRVKVSRVAVSTVTRNPASTSAFAVARAR